MHAIKLPANNRLKSIRYTWDEKLFIAFVLIISGIATTYTLVNLILEGL